MMITDELISDAYYLSGIVSRDLETVAGSQLSDGLRILNQILSEKSMSGRYIPYYGHSTLNTVQGQEEYNVTGLIITDAVTFNIGEVRYSMRRENRKYYFGSPRVDNIESLPFTYYPERVLGGTTLYLYFLPADVYEVKITGKFSLSQLAADTDLDPLLDGFYISLLTYNLAKRLCEFYSISFSAEKIATFESLEDQINDISETDFTSQKFSTMSNRTGYNWGDVNIGRGWRP